MPTYQYRAQNMSGKIIEGVYDAADARAVAEMIRQKSFYILEINEVRENQDIGGFFARIGKRDIAVFCRQFSTILKAGVTLVHALSMLSAQTENKTLKKILKDISEEVQKGSSLSGAMALHKQLPAILVNMVAAGEASGTLDESLEVMAVHFEKESKLQQKIQGAMIYPIIVCFFAVAVSWFLLVAVVPMFVGIFASAGAELPLPTRVILFLSNFLRNNGLVLFLGLVILAAAGKMYFSREESIITLHKNLLKVPLFGSLQLKSIAARFSRTLSTLMETGVEITEALEITGKVLGNAYASKRMREVELKVREGKGLYAPVRELELFPPMVENMIVLGEESGTLSTMLNRAAEFYEEEVDKQVDILTALMEPAMIVVLGGVVGFIVLAMVLPMFDMLSLVG